MVSSFQSHASVAREVLRIAPGSIHGRALLAGALARRGSTAEARRLGGQIAGLDPGFSSARHAEALPYATGLSSRTSSTICA